MTHSPATRSTRWDLLLPAVALAVATLLVALAALAGYAFRDREALALDGRIFGLAHRVELALREQGEGEAERILEEVLRAAGPEVRGVAVQDVDGVTRARSGDTDPRLPVRRVDIFVGPQGARPGPGPRGSGPRGSGPRGQRGRRTVVVHLDPRAASPPLSVRYLPHASVAVGLGLVVLAVLGGRLLVRQRREAAMEARTRRLEALGLAGAGLAHQLRNPLATIKGSCQLLEERLADPHLAERLRATVAQADRMDRMLATLLDFARPPQPEPRSLALGEVLGELERRHAALRVVGGKGLVVRADPEHVLQILENLAANALAAAPDDDAVEIAATRAGEVVEVRVRDRGPGPGDDPERLFQPYVTTRADGTGLGLPIARALAEANGGTLFLHEREGGGCAAVLTLPADGSAS